MPFNGSGTFQRVYNWQTDKNNSINITASRVDTEDTGFATGLSLCLTKDGQQVAAANLPMGGFAHTGVGLATLSNQYAVVSQVQSQSYSWIAAGGTADAITATYSPALTSLIDGLVLKFRATAANATTTPTFAPNGLLAHTITKKGGSALAANDIAAALSEYELVYNLANTRWELMNPSSSSIAASALTGTTLASNVVTSSLTTVGALASGSLAAGFTSVSVAQGGTGLATLTANNVILGNGTSAPNFVAPGSSGNVLKSNGTTWTSAAPAASYTLGTSLTLNPYTLSATGSQAHGLSSTPNDVLMYFENISTEAGYAVGERIPFRGSTGSSGNSTITVSCDATNLIYNTNTADLPDIVNKSGFARQVITASKWKVIMIPVLF